MVMDILLHSLEHIAISSYIAHYNTSIWYNIVTNQIHRDVYHYHRIPMIPYKATVEFAACLAGHISISIRSLSWYKVRSMCKSNLHRSRINSREELVPEK